MSRRNILLSWPPRRPPPRTHDFLGRPLTDAARKFYRLRDNGYQGAIDQDGNAVGCIVCTRHDCTRQGFAGRCAR